MKKVLVVLADGFEELEALAPVDLLRRAKCEVLTCGLGKKSAVSSRKVCVTTDTEISKVKSKDFDCIVLPGGMPGATNIANSNEVRNIVSDLNNSGKIVSAICASPSVVLAAWGLLDNKNAVCYPGMEDKSKPVNWNTSRVCWDKNILTSRGAGCAVEFALELVKVLVSEDMASEIASKIIL